MTNSFSVVCKGFLFSLAMILCGSVVSLHAQHGDVAGGGIGGRAGANAGATMKLPAKKPTRPTTSNTTKPKTSGGTTKPTQPDNSAQMEDALSLADDARQAERYEAAERGYQLAAKLAPGDPRPYLGLGHIYYSQKKYPEAEKFYTRAAALARGDSEAFARLAFTYTEMNRLDEALVAGRRAV